MLNLSELHFHLVHLGTCFWPPPPPGGGWAQASCSVGFRGPLTWAPWS